MNVKNRTLDERRRSNVVSAVFRKPDELGEGGDWEYPATELVVVVVVVVVGRSRVFTSNLNMKLKFNQDMENNNSPKFLKKKRGTSWICDAFFIWFWEPGLHFGRVQVSQPPEVGEV